MAVWAAHGVLPVAERSRRRENLTNRAPEFQAVCRRLRRNGAITVDREMEMLGRYEENAYFIRMRKVVGHKDVTLYELQGYGHGMVEPAIAPMLKWMRGKGSNAETPET